MRTGIFGEIGGEGKISFSCSAPTTSIEQYALHESDSSVFALHGLWLNPEHKDWSHLPINDLESFASTPQNFNYIDGPLQAFHYNKNNSELHLHVDFARQHPIFYFHENNFFAFAPTIEQLVNIMKSNGITPVADAEGAAMLLTYACILGDSTLIHGVKKLMPGHSLKLAENKVTLIDRSRLIDIARDVNNMDDAIESIQDAFSDSIKQMCDTNAHHGKTQLNLLSGGIDSRMVFFQTKKFIDEIDTLCFSVKDYVDHKVSKQISYDYNANYHFHDLKNGEYILNTSSAIQYDGTISYLASAHHRDVIESLTIPNLGVVAGGAIGNGVLSEEFFIPNSNKDQVISNTMTNPEFYKYCKYSTDIAWENNPESSNFKLVNRGFLYTNSGSYSTYPHGVLHSPFTSKAFVKAAHALHPDLLSNHSLYMEWMKRCHPEATNYIWERYRAKPVQGIALNISKLKMKVLAKFIFPLTNHKGASMSPVQLWYNNSNLIKDLYAQTLDSKKHLLTTHLPDLAQAIISSYPAMSVGNKASVLTLLIALDTYLD